MLSFCLSDETNGIVCKKFFKPKRGKDSEEDFVEIISKLKEGMEVRIRGSVRFDTYMNEYVLFIDSLAKKEKTVREDKAEVKRVELHAHTTMSAMDAVVSVKDLLQTAERWGWPAIAVTDHGVVQAFPDAMKIASKSSVKVIYGMEGYLTGNDYDQKRANHIIFLAKNPNGLRNLYQMVSLSHVKYFHRQPRLPKKIVQEYREGILIGSACEAGELIRAIEEGQGDEQLLKIAEFYDYLEIQPNGNNAFMLRTSDREYVTNKRGEEKKNRYWRVNSEEDLINITEQKSLEEKIISDDEKISLYKRMQKLDEKTREVMYLRISGELTFKEIADILNKTETWARVTFYRGKNQLKEVD